MSDEDTKSTISGEEFALATTDAESGVTPAAAGTDDDESASAGLDEVVVSFADGSSVGDVGVVGVGETGALLLVRVREDGLEEVGRTMYTGCNSCC